MYDCVAMMDRRLVQPCALRQQLHSLARPQPAEPSAAPISGLHEVTVASVCAAQQHIQLDFGHMKGCVDCKRASNRDVAMEHPLTPWIVRRTACIINRHATHSKGATSYFNTRVESNALIFASTVQHMLPTVKQFPIREPRF